MPRDVTPVEACNSSTLIIAGNCLQLVGPKSGIGAAHELAPAIWGQRPGTADSGQSDRLVHDCQALDFSRAVGEVTMMPNFLTDIFFLTRIRVLCIATLQGTDAIFRRPGQSTYLLSGWCLT